MDEASANGSGGNSGQGYQLLIKQLLFAPAVRNPDQQIVYRDLKRLTYRQFHARVAQLANALTSLGIGQGDVVAVMDWDSHRYLECFFAIPMIGAVLQTVNIRLSPEQILYTLNHARPKLLLVNTEFLPLLKEVGARVESVKDIILIVDDAVAPIEARQFSKEYESWIAAQPPRFDFPDFSENMPATTFYTTGTTGLPKAVHFTHRQLVLHTLAALATYGTAAVQGRLHQADVYMPITPMFHVHAWGLPYAATTLALKQVYPGRYSPETLLRLKKTEGVTFSHCVPAILHMLLSDRAGQDVDMHGWKIITGGSALPKGLALAAEERGIDIFCGYGMSETGPLSTIAHLAPSFHRDPDKDIDTRITAGRPVILVEVRTVDTSMRDTPRDGVTAGEVVLRSPWLTQGYRGDPEGTRKLWEGGYLHTGDIGILGEDGYLRLVDRLKDVIKTGGEWVSSLDIENVISQHPAVGEVAVIGVKNDRWGERPVALVVLKAAGAELTPDDIKAHMARYVSSGAISKYGVPDDIRFVESLPKTSVGKLDKKLMRDQFGEGR
ncbi:MAG TPA: fatty acid--CoA ligase [Hyphomicrobiaceae bacterium]